MAERERDEDLPLHDEAQAREQWRGGATTVGKDGKDAGRPASEVDDAAATGGAGSAGAAGRPGKGRPGSFPPPD